MTNSRFLNSIGSGLAMLCFACHTSEGSTEDIAFEDRSAALNWERVNDPGSAHLGGAAWLDYDRDGDLDLFLPNAPGGDNALFRNDGGSFVDVAGEAGITGEGSGFTGANAADINNDGCVDLFLTGAGGFIGLGRPSRLYTNRCDGTFEDTTPQSGIDANHLALMSAFGDIDNDGFVDLLVASPGDLTVGQLTPQKLYHNQGDGTFIDISELAGIDTARGGCVAGFSDVNDDGWMDLLMGNCANLDTSGPQPLPIPGPWEMWINQGDRTFVDVAKAAGLRARDGFPMAIALGDTDQDGALDLFSTGMGPNNPFAPGLAGEHVMFQNNGDGTYRDVTHASGLGDWEWAWGAAFADFDNDGDEDLVEVGSVAIGPLLFIDDLASPGRIHENDGEGNFSAALEFDLQRESTSGLAVADYDGDGYPDLVIIKTAFETLTPDGPISGDGHPVLLRNLGHTHRSITVQLVGTQSNRMGIGARVTSSSSIGVQTREVAAGSSFASTNSPWLTFGLGDDDTTELTVRWPSGLTERFVRPASTDLQILQEGTGEP
ncbi:MAG: CRTAC1 family protein [Myxococcota bacterium]